MGILTDPIGGYEPPYVNPSIPNQGVNPVDLTPAGIVELVEGIGDYEPVYGAGTYEAPDVSNAYEAPDVSKPHIAGEVSPSAESGQVGLEKRAREAEKVSGKEVGRRQERTAQESQKEALKRNETGTVKMDVESIVLGFLDKKGVESQFETDLLDGRLELGGVRASFLVGDKAMRLFEQDDSRRTVEKAQLESQGFQVVDCSPSRLVSLLALNDLLGDLRES